MESQLDVLLAWMLLGIVCQGLRTQRRTISDRKMKREDREGRANAREGQHSSALEEIGRLAEIGHFEEIGQTERLPALNKVGAFEVIDRLEEIDGGAHP